MLFCFDKVLESKGMPIAKNEKDMEYFMFILIHDEWNTIIKDKEKVDASISFDRWVWKKISAIKKALLKNGKKVNPILQMHPIAPHPRNFGEHILLKGIASL